MAERIFIFTNIGTEPLIIKRIQSSCGCTVPKKPENQLCREKKGEIKVSYDTNRVGGFLNQLQFFRMPKILRKVIRVKGYVASEVSFEKEKSMLSDN